MGIGKKIAMKWVNGSTLLKMCFITDIILGLCEVFNVDLFQTTVWHFLLGITCGIQTKLKDYFRQYSNF